MCHFLRANTNTAMGMWGFALITNCCAPASLTCSFPKTNHQENLAPCSFGTPRLPPQAPGQTSRLVGPRVLRGRGWTLTIRQLHTIRCCGERPSLTECASKQMESAAHPVSPGCKGNPRRERGKQTRMQTSTTAQPLRHKTPRLMTND